MVRILLNLPFILLGKEEERKTRAGALNFKKANIGPSLLVGHTEKQVVAQQLNVE